MQFQTDGRRFTGSRSLDIAVALRDEPRTVQRCAQVLGVQSGTIYRQLHRMVDEGLLTAEGPPTGKGTRYRLDPAHIGALEAELGAQKRDGRLVAEQPILLVEAGRLLDIALALQADDLSTPVLWAAQFDDDDFLFALDAELSPVLRGRLRSALEASGVSCKTQRVSRIIAGDELRSYLSSLRDAGA